MDIVFPDPNTAFIMDEVIREYYHIQNTKDDFVALVEFATGRFDTSHTLDVGFGFNRISPIYSQEDFVLGQGIYRVNASPVPSIFPPYIDNNPYRIYPFDPEHIGVHPQQYLAEYPLPVSIQTLLAPLVLKNVYMFASVYFSPNESTKINTDFVRGENGLPISLIKDIDFDAVKQLVMDDLLNGTASIASDAIELYKIIIDVDYFNGVAGDLTNIVTSYIVDQRKCRGWAGFAEENFSANLVPALIRYRNAVLTSINTNTKGNSLDDRIESLVDTWKDLDWPGGFDTFWLGGDYALPPYINEYIYGYSYGYRASAVDFTPYGYNEIKTINFVESYYLKITNTDTQNNWLQYSIDGEVTWETLDTKDESVIIDVPITSFAVRSPDWSAKFEYNIIYSQVSDEPIVLTDYVSEPEIPVSDYIVAAVYYTGGWVDYEDWDMFSSGYRDKTSVGGTSGYVSATLERLPLIGKYNSNNPEVIDWQTSYAVSHGINTFIPYLYYDGSVSVNRNSSEIWIDQFRKSKYFNKINYALMWTNDQNAMADPVYHDNPESFFSGFVTRMMDSQYFMDENYLKINGNNVLIPWHPDTIEEAFVAHSSVTVDIGTSKITKSNHGYVENQALKFYCNTYPAYTQDGDSFVTQKGKTVYVRLSGCTSDEFRISRWSGNITSAVFTSTGDGVNVYKVNYEDSVRDARISGVFDQMRETASGYGGLMIVGMYGDIAEDGNRFSAQGYDAIINYGTSAQAGFYSGYVSNLASGFNANHSGTSLSFIPMVDHGFSTEPQWGPFTDPWPLSGKSPELFQDALQIAKNYVDANPISGANKMVMLNAWNEQGEGNYIEPSVEYGFDLVNSIKNVFVPTFETTIEEIPSELQKSGIDTTPVDINKSGWYFSNPADRVWVTSNQSTYPVYTYSGLREYYIITNTDDHNIYHPRFAGVDNLYINTSLYNTFETRIKITPLSGYTPPSNPRLQVYYSNQPPGISGMNTPGYPGYIAAAGFGESGYCDGQWHVYSHSLSDNLYALSGIRQLRIDPMEPSTSGMRIEIDYIQFVEG